MAGVRGHSGAIGKSFEARERAAGVRNLALSHLEKILSPSYKDKKYQKEMLLRIAGNLLPRLNEVTGADGEALVIKFDNAFTSATEENS